jgi:hypothetical protein
MATAPFYPTTTQPTQRADVLLVTVTDDGQPIIYSRGERVSASEWLLNRFKHRSLRWSNQRRTAPALARAAHNEDVPQIRFGLILSGNVLIDNS